MFTVLRKMKHRLFLVYKPYRFPIANAVEPLFRFSHRIRPPRFDPADWPETELTGSIPVSRQTTEPVPRQIFIFWTGPNPFSRNREEAFASIKAHNPDIPVRLITPENMEEFLLPEHPLHPAYEHLSLIHRSDYLRCYALHYHGGGYADLKRATASWAGVFDRMDASDAWVAGYRVPVRLMTPNMPDPRLEKVMRKFSEQRLGQNAYISRPDTPITAEWWTRLNSHLTARHDDLAACPGNARGDNAGYPLHLNEILAQILDPIEVKYREHLLYDQRLFMDPENYI